MSILPVGGCTPCAKVLGRHATALLVQSPNPNSIPGTSGMAIAMATASPAMHSVRNRATLMMMVPVQYSMFPTAPSQAYTARKSRIEINLRCTVTSLAVRPRPQALTHLLPFVTYTFTKKVVNRRHETFIFI